MVRNNAIEMYSTYNKGKSIIAERFIRTLKNKIYIYIIYNIYIYIYIYITSLSKNVYNV